MANMRYHEKIQQLTANQIKNIFKEAQEKYLTGNAEDPRTTTYYNRGVPITCQTHLTDVANKNLFSLGTSYLFRFFKAKARLPTIADDTTNEKARELLMAVLKDGGGNDLSSLKYMVASLIMKDYKNNDEDAKHLIDTLTGETSQRRISYDGL